MKSLLLRLTVALFLTPMFSNIAAAGQQPANRQRPPRLTTDDIIREPASQPSGESKEGDAKPADAPKTDKTDPKGEPAKAADIKVSAEETSWRDQVGKARSRANELERTAEEAELRVTALRNDLGASGQSVRQRNDTAAELSQAGQKLTDLQNQARAAADDAAQLIEYGRQKGFAEAEGPKATSEEGKPNEDYFRTQFAKLTEALQSAQRRVRLYDNRIRDLNQQITANSSGRNSSGKATGGDSFFAAQLYKDRDEAQQKLEESRSAEVQAQNDLYALREEARRAGVPPGLFR